MLWTMTLMLAGMVDLPGQPRSPTPPNFRFDAGRLTGWEGDGFYITTATGRGPSLRFGVCSSDAGGDGRTALLHRTVVVPPNVGAIRFTAAVVRPANCPPGPELDVVLEASGRRFLPRLLRQGNSYQPAPALLPYAQARGKGQLQEYCWPVSSYSGQTLRIALVDRDDRPGCYLICGGFEFVSREEFEGRQFVAEMVDLSQKHDLPPLARLDSKHFRAISNTVDDYTELRLYNCETIYALFFDHFRRKGFTVREPGGKLMVAIFDSQAGFEAYLGQRMPTSVTGLYHLESNRLVVYDYARNRAFMATKSKGEQQLKDVPYSLQKQRVISDFTRQTQTFRNDANIGTIMHEVAHQLAFNGGLLNRQGDAGLWLVEGMACYCEATRNGEWQGIGEPNPQRLGVLARVLEKGGEFIPLLDMVRSDDWLRQQGTTVSQALLGYAQSWALYRYLMEVHPRKLREYLALIYPRRTPEQRLADFAEVFGGDVPKFEAKYHQYIRTLVRDEHRPMR
jgi:Protein of unknown function (DUF1570)